jgi:hypothetical protein
MNAMLQLLTKTATVGGYAVAEKIKPPVPRTADDVPISGSKVTTEWLTAVLCRDVPGARVVAFENPGGSSGSTERVGLRVRYNDAGRQTGLPTELFTKGAENFRQRMLTGGGGVIEGEVHFYRGLRDKTTAEAPRGYWAAADPRSWRSIAVMEDIATTRGARFIGPTERLTREQMHDLVRMLAHLHGDLWQYCVNSACEPADRREWERTLMEAYLESLAEHGGDAPSFDDGMLAYRRQSFWPFIAWAFTIGRAWYQPEMQPVDRCKAIIRRTASAIEDLDSFGAMGL